MTIGAPKKPDDVDQAAWDAAGKVADAYRSNQEVIARGLMAYRSPLEAALRTIRSAVPGYLKGEMSEHDFALLVLENVDSGKVNKALEKGR